MTSASQDNVSDVSQLLKDLRDDRFWVRERAAETLGYRRSQAAVTGLLAALGDATSTVRDRAAEALVRIGSEEALTGLHDTLGREKVTEILSRTGLQEVVDDVQQIHLEQTTDTLYEALRHDLHAERWQAAQGLWKLQGAQAIEALLQALREPEPESQHQSQQDARPASISDRPDEYTLLDILARQDFQAAWRLAQDLVQVDAGYAAMIFERVLDLTT
jgi:HEAT repeat protein